MRITRSIGVGVLLLAASSTVQAGWFGSKHPQPINVLSISRPWEPSHTHPSLNNNKYNKTGWGSLWKQVFRNAPYHGHPYVKGY